MKPAYCQQAPPSNPCQSKLSATSPDERFPSQDTGELPSSRGYTDLETALSSDGGWVLMQGPNAVFDIEEAGSRIFDQIIGGEVGVTQLRVL